MIADRLDALIRAIPTDPTWMAPDHSVAAERKKRKKRRKNKKGKKGNIFVRCQAQVAPCAAFLLNLCGSNPCPQVACCDDLATCDADGFLFCLNTPPA